MDGRSEAPIGARLPVWPAWVIRAPETGHARLIGRPEAWVAGNGCGCNYLT